MDSSDLSAHAERNREVWTRAAAEYVAAAERGWATDEISWGIYGVREAELGALADVELEGRDVVELGCGTAYFSAWFARRGARPVGVDVTPAQLETARRLQREHALEFPLVEASAEDVPLPDASFDLAFSEYGASIWADPYRWIPEASRLLRPGGRLVFLKNSILAMLCMPDTGRIDEVLKRPYRGMHRFEWPGEDEGIDFHLGFGDTVRLLREQGFALEDYVEVYAPEGATTRYDWSNDTWARQWPIEEIWKARKAA
ncbi:MAG: class I SAM-dependent methyltransferase [Pseudomonadota bacterium]